MSGLQDVQTIIRQIEDLQIRAFQNIHNIDDDNASDSTEPLEISREHLVKDTSVIIRNMQDLILAASLEIQQLPHETVGQEFLKETLDLCKGKVSSLRSALKESQLAAHNNESSLIHNQRLREYGYFNETTNQSDDLREQRNALFAGRSLPHEIPESKERSVDEQIVKQNKNITSSLQQSKQLMTMSVMQTELNIDNLDQQSKDLTRLNNKLIDMETLLGKSKQIVKFIEQQDKKDKRRIYAAVCFLVLCSAWVVWRRLLKIPVKLMLWAMFKAFGVFNWTTKVLYPLSEKQTRSHSLITTYELTVSSPSTLEMGSDTIDQQFYSTLSTAQPVLQTQTTIAASQESPTDKNENYTSTEDTIIQDINDVDAILTWDELADESSETEVDLTEASSVLELAFTEMEEPILVEGIDSPNTTVPNLDLKSQDSETPDDGVRVSDQSKFEFSTIDRVATEQTFSMSQMYTDGEQPTVESYETLAKTMNNEDSKSAYEDLKIQEVDGAISSKTLVSTDMSTSISSHVDGSTVTQRKTEAEEEENTDVRGPSEGHDEL